MKKNKIIISIILTMLLIFSYTTIAIETYAEHKEKNESYPSNIEESPPYQGHLRIYVVEPESRWDMIDGKPYHYGFLDFAINEKLSIEYLDTYEETVIWNASNAGYSDVEEDNIIVMAAVFNPESKQKYAYPSQSKNPFDAHYVDAATATFPGEIGYNTVTENFTHTIFAEEASAPWCTYCPDMAEKLYLVYKYYDYPFYFVTLVADVDNQDAEDRLFQNYNLYGYPTTFFDGGYEILVGSDIDREVYLDTIESCGKRDVHELNLTLGVEWIGNGDLEIYVSVASNEEVPNEPPEKHTIIGPTSGKAGEEYNYTFISTDPEGHDVYYLIDWGDNTSTEWLGLYDSGEEITLSHIWAEQGNHTIKAKAKDVYGLESEWAYLEVSMPKNRIINTFTIFLERLMERFPILEEILQPIYDKLADF